MRETGRQRERTSDTGRYKELTMHSESEGARDGEYEMTIDNDDRGALRITRKGEEGRP